MHGAVRKAGVACWPFLQRVDLPGSLQSHLHVAITPASLSSSDSPDSIAPELCHAQCAVPDAASPTPSFTLSRVFARTLELRHL
eukprot:scaffold29085_cov112-Isochrysis_galbana.AAC.4